MLEGGVEFIYFPTATGLHIGLVASTGLITEAKDQGRKTEFIIILPTLDVICNAWLNKVIMAV